MNLKEEDNILRFLIEQSSCMNEIIEEFGFKPTQCNVKDIDYFMDVYVIKMGGEIMDNFTDDSIENVIVSKDHPG